MTTPPDTHLELYVRAQTTTPITRRLAALRADVRALAGDRGWSVGVTQWPRKIDPSGDPDSVAEHVYDEFRSWADAADVALDPAFQTRRCYSFETGRPYEAVVLPVACLAVRHDSDLVGVYPHRDGTAVRTIPEAIDALATGPEPPVDRDAPDEAPVQTTP